MMDEELYQKIKSFNINEMDNFLVIIYNQGVKAMAEFIENEAREIREG
ncbi:MAG: hypothetical protein ACI3ZR_08735 [bacterium]